MRAAAIYVAVFFMPLALACYVWPATTAIAKRTVELLAALILSKFVIVATLTLGVAALHGGPVTGQRRHRFGHPADRRLRPVLPAAAGADRRGRRHRAPGGPVPPAAARRRPGRHHRGGRTGPPGRRAWCCRPRPAPPRPPEAAAVTSAARLAQRQADYPDPTTGRRQPMADTARRYTFHPRWSGGGCCSGLQAGQIGTLAGGAAGARSLSRPGAARTGRAPAWPSCSWPDRWRRSPCWPRCRRPLVGWLPVAGRLGPGSGASGCAVTLADRSRGRARARVRRGEPGPGRGAPAPPGIDLVEVDGGPGHERPRVGSRPAVGYVGGGRSRSQGRSFVLLDGDEPGRAAGGRGGPCWAPWPGRARPCGASSGSTAAAPVASDRGRGRGDGRPVCRRDRLPGRRIAGRAGPESYRQLVADDRGRSPSPTRPGWSSPSAAPHRPRRPSRPLARRAAARGSAPRRPPAQRRSCEAGPPLGLDALRALLGAAYRPRGAPTGGRSRARPVADGHRRGLVGACGLMAPGTPPTGSPNGPGSRSIPTS